MIGSRCYNLSKLYPIARKNVLLSNKRVDLKQTITRNCHVKYYYRTAPHYKDPYDKYALLFGSFVWWWLVWHTLTDFHVITGVPAEDPSQWTDEELGIPED